MRIILVIVFVSSAFTHAQTWEDSSYVPIWLEVYLNQERSSFDDCDGLPTFYLFEDDSLVYKEKLLSRSDTISINFSKDSSFNITSNHNYNLELVFEDRHDKKLADNFSTHEVEAPTKYIRDIQFRVFTLSF